MSNPVAPMPSATTNATIVLPFPVGTIISYIGDPSTLGGLATTGWLVCDGSPYSSKQYPALYTLLGIAYGGNGNPNFNMPDLRGQFLRGCDPTGVQDPGYNARMSRILGNPSVIGPVVGSRQGFAVQNHVHNWDRNFAFIGDGGNDISVQLGYQSLGGKDPDRSPGPTTNNDGGGPETRPTNVYVFFLIFAGLPQAAAH